MASADPFAPGSALLNYKLGQRVSTSVWQAEDTRNKKKVAIKLLSRQLPKDATRREALVRDVRLAGAIYHTSLVNILEIAVAGDALIMVMDWFDGQPLSARVKTKPLDRPEFMKLAYQIADALKMLHAKNLTHSNITGDSVMISANGHARLGGLNTSNLLPRPGQPSAFQQRGSDARAVAYMAPEQISGQQVTLQTDIFSLGLVLYEAATGKLAYQGENAPEIARKVVNEQPPSPKMVNPNIDNAVLGIMGRCLYKDPFRRHKDTKAILDEITRADPDAQKFATSVGKTSPGSTAQPASGPTKSTILFVADVAGKPDTKAGARMQQILGEAVYLFDGQVLDPFGPRLIAELPTVEAALEAGRKGEFDFSPEQQDAAGEEPIMVRLLLTAGDVQVRDGKVSGAAVTKAIEVLQAIEPLKLFISEEFAKRGRGKVRLRDSGARAGVKLYTIVPTEKPAPVVVEDLEPEPEPEEEVAAAEEEGAAAPAAAAKKKRTMLIAVAAAVAVAILGGGAIMLFSKPKSEPVAAVTHTSAPKIQTDTGPKGVFIEPFTVEGTDTALEARANQIRLASIEMLRMVPDIHVADAGGAGVTPITATVRTGTAGPEIVTGTNAVPMLDAASGIQAVTQYVTNEMKLPQQPQSTAAAYNAFAEAVVANAAGDPKKTDVALRTAIKADANFLPALLLAMHFFTTQGKDADAIVAAKQVLTIDASNLEAAQIVARVGLKTADLASAIAGYGAILKRDPTNVEALNVLGRYALSASDTAKFNAALQKLSATPDQSVIQAPDLLLVTGRLDDAAQSYYSVEDKSPNNPSLALKIGKLAVLRHSAQMADVELAKLEKTDPNYGAHILKAYIAASSGTKATADAELQAALAASKPGDDYYTNVAEVAVISNDPKAAFDALQKAVGRKEPTASYILANPLFRFLQSEADYARLHDDLVAQQNEARTALAGVAL
jgi:Flp pilus assembly protein TadD